MVVIDLILIRTSGMSTTAKKRKAADYDPARQWGLKPETGSRGLDGETTYVLGGFVASSSTAPGIAGETMGREGQARAKRRLDKNNDKALKEMLEKNKSGSSVFAQGSREALEIVRRAKEAMAKARKKEKDAKRKSIDATDADGDDDTRQEENQSTSEGQSKRKSYSAEMIKQLGFDPTQKPYGQNGDKKKVRHSCILKPLILSKLTI